MSLWHVGAADLGGKFHYSDRFNPFRIGDYFIFAFHPMDQSGLVTAADAPHAFRDPELVLRRRTLLWAGTYRYRSIVRVSTTNRNRPKEFSPKAELKSISFFRYKYCLDLGPLSPRDILSLLPDMTVPDWKRNKISETEKKKCLFLVDVLL